MIYTNSLLQKLLITLFTCKKMYRNFELKQDSKFQIKSQMSFDFVICRKASKNAFPTEVLYREKKKWDNNVIIRRNSAIVLSFEFDLLSTESIANCIFKFVNVRKIISKNANTRSSGIRFLNFSPRLSNYLLYIRRSQL